MFSENLLLTFLLIELLLRFCYLIYQDGQNNFSNISVINIFVKNNILLFFSGVKPAIHEHLSRRDRANESK
jgi:hypothetical protein